MTSGFKRKFVFDLLEGNMSEDTKIFVRSCCECG